ncbi:MAG TPA: GIY-YIG nuclease family protein [Methyloceanibacter sp.]|nr:GIY-YIG nuclease family protein [Methyloceanibacter sp.]
MDSQPCVYILASRRNGTLYTGVTRYPSQRIWQHKGSFVRGFTKRYGVHILVYIELHDTMPAAIKREKQIKEWKRVWKLQLIESVNPSWRDLYEDFLRKPSIVIPAQAESSTPARSKRPWIPAYACMTESGIQVRATRRAAFTVSTSAATSVTGRLHCGPIQT